MTYSLISLALVLSLVPLMALSSIFRAEILRPSLSLWDVASMVLAYVAPRIVFGFDPTWKHPALGAAIIIPLTLIGMRLARKAPHTSTP